MTTTVTAGGSTQQQVSISSNYGESAAYAYAIGKPKFSQDATGVQTRHDYEATTEHGAIHKHTVTTKANGALVAAQSRKTEEFIAADGTTSFEQESIWDGENWLLLNTTVYEYDEQQRVVKTTHGNGRFSTTAWMCCGRLSETNEDGITTTYGYNSAHQLVEMIREEVKDGDVIVTPETITTYTRDAAGRTLTTRRDVGAMTTTESTEYDILGRVTRQTDILGRVTTTAYSADGLTTTTTTPAGATTITLRNADGSTARISGTAQRELHYSYTRNGNNLAITVSLPNGSILSQNITNGNGQTLVTATPNTLGGFIYTRSEYNAKGQLTKQYQDTGSGTESTAPTLYEYDSFGNVTKQTLALSTTPTKDNSPVVEMAYSVESTEEGVFSITTNTRYNAEGQFSYNHLGQAVQVPDGSSTRTCGYNNCSKAESCPYTQHLETLSLKARAEYGKERVSMKKLLSIASILAALAGTASAAPYYLPSPQYGALTPYDMQPVYAIDATYAVGDNEMLDTWGVRGSFNLYNDAEGTFRHQFNVGVGYEYGDEKIDTVKTEIYMIPITGGYDLNIELTDGILLTIGGKAGYTIGEIEDDWGYTADVDGFTFRVGGGLKVQCSDAVYIRAGYEFGRTYTDAGNFGQHIISVGVGCQF